MLVQDKLISIPAPRLTQETLNGSLGLASKSITYIHSLNPKIRVNNTGLPLVLKT